MTRQHQLLKQSVYVLVVMLLIVMGRFELCHAREKQWKSIPERAKEVLFEAQQEMGNKNYTKAIQVLTTFQQKSPKQNHFLVDFNIGTAYALTNNLPEAIRHFEKAAAMEPSYAPVWRNLGKLYYDTREYPKAGEALERSFRLETKKDPNILYIAMAAFFQADDMDKTISLGEELLLKIKKINADILGLLVNAYIKEKNFDRALHTLKKLQQWSPGDSKLWKLRAQCHINKNEYELAAIAYEIYGYLAGLAQDELWTMGDLFAMIGLPKRAAQYYETALETGGGSAEDYEKLSTAYYGAYEFSHAINALDRALAMKSTSERLLLKAQLSYLQDNFGDAEQYYADAAKTFSQDGHEWLMAGYCAMRAGDTATAKKWLLEASKYPEQRNEAQNLIKMISDREKLRAG